MILLADRVLDGTDDQQTFGGLDITVRRNAFGRQVESFEADVELVGLTAGRCTRCSSGPRGWSSWTTGSGAGLGHPAGPDEAKIIAVRQRNLLATSFHPEVTGDLRIHRYFLDLVRAAW